MAKQDNDQPTGVRGPGGPPPIPSKPSGKPAGRAPSSRKPSKPSGPAKLSNPSSPTRSAFETKSYPLLVTLQRVPRWVMVVLPAALLFLGLIQTGGLASGHVGISAVADHRHTHRFAVDTCDPTFASRRADRLEALLEDSRFRLAGDHSPLA